MGKACTKSKKRHERKWKPHQQEKRNCFKSVAREIEKIKKENLSITANMITSLLNCAPNFLGCFADDQLDQLKITSFPCFLVANLDYSNQAGTHWIGLGIFKEKIEIFDPLGFDIFNWPTVPCGLMNFLHRLSVTRHVEICPRIQSDSSRLCGIFSIFYILKRKTASMKEIYSSFNLTDFEANDCILLDCFK